MKLARLSTIALATVLAMPVAASAQEYLQFGGVKTPGGDQIHGAQTGAYTAKRAPFTSSFDIYCIDYDNHAMGSWTARAVTFQQAVGIYSTQANRQLGTTPSWGVNELRAAAYLTTRFSALPQNQWDDVHGAIWSMFSSSPDLAGHTSMAAGALAATAGDNTWDSYVVLLDNNAFNPNYRGALNQVFITNDPNTTVTVVTPEPSTWALMGAGLFAVGLVRRRRRVA
jgi:PEP-CTERM motif-containing protein